MKKILLIVLIISALFIVGCQESKGENETSTESSIPEIVENYSMGRGEPGEIAAITSDELFIVKDGEETAIDITDEEFFISFAPYINQTHP